MKSTPTRDRSLHIADTAERPPGMTRRQLLAGAAGLGAGALIVGWPAMAEAIEALPAPGQPSGEFLGTVPFLNTGNVQFGEASGAGLEGRRFLDPSTLSESTLVTPSDRFFLHTRKPDALPPADQWQVRVRLYGTGPERVPMEWFTAHERDMGVHLIEGASNGPGVEWGLISAARWTGVPVTELFAGFSEEGLHGLLISGHDRHLQPVADAQAGASWIFSFDQLRETGAFLATKINGQPLSEDQGAPLRLVVPGWFGCAHIKWVQDVVAQDLQAPSTPQMLEYARRTFQKGKPRLAAHYHAAKTGLSLLPVRVERWRVDGEIVHRIVGIVWGGTAPVDQLSLRVVAEDEPRKAVLTPQPITHFTWPASTSTWALWSHTVRLPAVGVHRIAPVRPDRQTYAPRIDGRTLLRRFVVAPS
jgi:hypothetical protein